MFNGEMTGVLAGDLVGRASAVDTIENAIEQARTGGGTCLVLVGEPGVGKSRLVREASRLSNERSVRTFVGRAVADSTPLGALVSAFVSYGRRTPFPAAPELEPFRGLLGTLVPDWAVPSREPVSPREFAPLLAEALVRLVRLSAPQGGLLVLEDLHDSDQDTLTVLDHLCDGVGSAGLTVLVTLRPGSPLADGWLAGVLGRRVATELLLEPLDNRSTAELVRVCLRGSAPSALVGFIVEHSDGLPLLVEDLLAALVAAGALAVRDGRWSLLRPLEVDVPRSFSDTVARRMKTLPSQAVPTLRTAAMLGRRFDWRLLSEIVDLDPDEVLRHLRAAVARQLVTAEPEAVDDFEFRHLLTREVIIADLLPPERQRLAADAAEVVQRAAFDDETLMLAARLHAEAGAAERAAEILLDLGLRFLGRGALDAATDALGRARSLSVDPAVADRILDVLVQVHAAAGRVEDAFEVGEALLRRAPAAAAAQRVHLCLARVATLAGRPDQATRHLDAILAGVPEQVGGSILRAALAVNRRSPEEAEQLSIAALEHARSHGDADSVCEALLVRGRAARLRSATDAERWFEQAHQTAERDGLILWQVRALHELGTIDLLESGRTDRLSAAHELSTSLGAHETAAHVDLHLGILLAHRGDHDAAAKRLRSSLEYGVKLHMEGLRRIAAAQLGYVHALGGNGEAAEAAIASVVEDPLVDDADHIAQGLAKPFTRLLVEDRSGALELMDRAVVRSADRSWPQWGVRALLHAVEGVDSADDELTSVLPAEPGRLQHAYLLFAVAVARGRAGDVVGASTAVAAGWERLGWQVAHRRFCLRQLGEAAARDGWGEPVSWLVEALEEFRGVPAVASACRRLIKEAGGTVPRAGRGESSVPPTLRAMGVTSREMDVLKVLVEGSSNEEIAARLHLSRRTVEGHVTSLLAKTMAESRGQLVTRFANSVASQP